MKTNTSFAAILALAYLATSCQSDPYAFDYTRSKPAGSLVGTYAPTKQTRLLLDDMYKNVKDSQLVLRADSSFSIQDIANFWSPFPTAGGFENVKGRWSLRRNQDWWAVWLEVTFVREADGHLNHTGYSTPVMLIGQRPPYMLHFTLGDPDEGRVLQYERQ